VYSGSVGGPLVDLDGLVIGMNAAPLEEKIGIGLAIPADLVKSIINQIIRNGKVIRSWLGVGLQEMTMEIAANFEYKFDSHDPVGVLVNKVIRKSPAQKSGIHPGDIIIAVNNKNISNVSELNRVISLIPFGTDASFKFFRQGDKFSKDISFDRQEETEVLQAKVIYSKPDWTGLLAGEKPVISNDGKRVEKVLFVASVANLSPAYSAGVKKNDIILSINNKTNLTFSDYEKEVKEKADDDDIMLRLLLKSSKDNVNRFVVIKKEKK